MHPRVTEAIQQIDAALFNGDTFFDDEARAELLEYVERWARQIPVVAGIAATREASIKVTR